MAQSLRQEYAARSQTSDIFGAQQQQEEDNQKPGRRVVQGQSANDIFSEGLGMDTNGDRKKPEPAPFLTEDNAVNTNGRRGGFVEKTDCYMESEFGTNGKKVHYQEASPEPLEEPYEDNCNRQEKFNENSTTAKNHKARNMTSHIFDAQTPEKPEEYKKTYNRDNMSNVF